MDDNRLTFYNVARQIKVNNRYSIIKKGDYKASDFFKDVFDSNNDVCTNSWFFQRTFYNDSKGKHAKKCIDKFNEKIQNNFNIENTANNIRSLAQKKKARELKSDDLKSFLNVERIGFEKNLSERVIRFIEKAMRNDPYIALTYLLILSLYPVSYSDSGSNEETHTLSPEDKELYENWVRDFLNTEEPVLKKMMDKSDTSNHEGSCKIVIRDLFWKLSDRQYHNAIEDAGRFVHVANVTENEKMELPQLKTTFMSEEGDVTLLTLITRLTPDLYSSDSRNIGILIIGEGGSGKTFSLLDAVKKLRQTHGNAIPIYIPLNIIDVSSNSCIEDFILNNLESESITGKKLLELISGDKIYPILMLDGFNEISDREKQSLVVQSVQKLKAYRNNFRFIITSRYDLSSTFAVFSGSNTINGFTAYKVCDMEQKYIVNYVKTLLKGISNTEINSIIENELKDPRHSDKPIRSFLRKPMGLAMFCQIHTGKRIPGDIPAQNSGELLEKYVRYVGLGLPDYGIRKADIRRIEKFLSFLAFKMSIDGVFVIGRHDFLSRCREFGLSKERAEELYEDGFVDYLMQFTNERHEVQFNHQNFRDYFAAVYIEDLILEMDVAILNKCLGTEVIPREVYDLLADILGEYKYVPGYSSGCQDISPIQSILTEKGSELVPPAVSELIKIAARGRNNDLSGFRFDGLDLSATRLNSITLSHGAYEYPASFAETKLVHETLAPLGHAGAVMAMLFVKDRYLLSFSKGGFMAFDMKERTQYQIADYPNSAISAVCLINDTIYTGDVSGTITKWTILTNKENGQICLERDTDLFLGDKFDFIYDPINTALNDIRVWNDKLLLSMRRGFVAKCDSDLTKLEKVYEFPEYKNDEHMKNVFVKSANMVCRAYVCRNNIYIAYGRKIIKLNDNSDVLAEISIDEGYIVDICALKIGRDDVLFINQRDPQNKRSRLLWVRNPGTNNIQYVTNYMYHSDTLHGFKGWNRFVEDSNHSVFIAANAEDTLREAGALQLSVICKKGNRGSVRIADEMSVSEIHGFKHKMALSSLCIFTFNGRRYIASGSLDRSIEVLDISSSMDGVLISELPGHDDGIHYLDIVDDDVIYTAHYSGEVCEWVKDENNDWKCRRVVKAHNYWVWETKHITIGDTDYIISCSYDHRISIINEQTGDLWYITEPNGRVLSFEVAFNKDDLPVILASFDDRDDNDEDGRAMLGKYVITNIEKEEYKDKGKKNTSNRFKNSISVFDNNTIRFIRKPENEDFILMCSSGKERDGRSYFAKIFQLDSINANVNNAVNRNNEILKISKNEQINIRTLDAIRDNNGTVIYAAAGDCNENAYCAIWTEESENTMINDDFPLEHSSAISSVRFCNLDDVIYFISASYGAPPLSSSIVSIHRVRLGNDNKPIVEQVCKVTDKSGGYILNVQVRNGKLYYSSLNGSVICHDIRDMLRFTAESTNSSNSNYYTENISPIVDSQIILSPGSPEYIRETRAKYYDAPTIPDYDIDDPASAANALSVMKKRSGIIFEALSGLNICGCDISKAITDYSPYFKQYIDYYGKA